MPDTWIRWGIEVIQLAQSHNSPIVDAVFRAITSLGYEEFYLLLIPLVFWCLDKRVGIRMTILLLLSVYVNLFIKDFLAWPRPPADQVRQVVDEETFGMPSGHAQNSIVLFGYLASAGTIGWGIAAFIALMVGVSRVFLGVHYPQDVIGGWGIGIVMLGISLVFLRASRGQRLPANVLWGMALFVPIALALLYSTRETVLAMGALWGLGVGYLLERRLIGFDPRTTWGRQVAKFVAGSVVLVALWLGLKALLPDGGIFRFTRYATVGLWGTFLAPWVFVRVGWAEAEKHIPSTQAPSSPASSS